MAVGLKCFDKERKGVSGDEKGRPDHRTAFVSSLSGGYFTYLFSQPKNSRFQTSEFWGLNT